MEPLNHSGAMLLCDAALAKVQAADPGLYEVVTKLVDWTRPGESAVALLGTAIENATRDWPREVTDVARILIRYQMHLSYLDGRDDAENERQGDHRDEYEGSDAS